MKKHSLLILTIAFLAQACAKDKSLEDWQREQVEQDLSELQSASGAYVGTGKSRRDGQPIGELRISLEAQTQVMGDTDGTKADEKPVLTGRVELQDTQNLQIVASDSYFDPETGRYQAQVTVPHSDGTTEQVILRGVITGDQFEGAIEALGFEQEGISFWLTRNAPATEPAALQSGAETDSALVLKTYRGTTRFDDGSLKPVTMVILKPRTTSSDDFLNLLVPVKSVQVTLNYGQTLELLHANARWDQRSNRLTGQSELGKALLALDCVGIERGWSCKHLSNSRGEVATTIVTEAEVALAGRGEALYSPGDAAIPDHSLLESFGGELKFASGAVEAASLEILYQRKASSTELEDSFVPPAQEAVQASLKFGQAFKLAFTQATLDHAAGTLSGSALISRLTDQVELTLDCRRSATADAPAPVWDCAVFSAALGRAAEGIFTLGAALPNEAHAQDILPIVETFRGDLSFDSGQSRPAALTVRFPRKTRETQLFERFFPSAKESVQVALSFGDSFEVELSGAQLDPSTGILSGSYVLTRGNHQVAITLDCRKIATDWDCRHLGTNSGNSATSRFAPGAPVASLPKSGAKSFSFAGKGKLPSGSTPAAQLLILQPALTHQEELVELFYPGTERLLQVTLTTFVVEGAPATAFFEATRWDANAGTLDGKAKLTSSGGVAVDLALRCQGLTSLDAPGTEITCTYFSNQMGAPAQFSFKR